MMKIFKIFMGMLFVVGCTVGTSAEQAAEPAQESQGRVFHIQLWDAHKSGWTDEALSEIADAGFTVVQHGWNGSLFPSRGLLDKVGRHGLSYGAYIDTRYLFRHRASPSEKKKARFAVDLEGGRDYEHNTFDPVYQEVVAREIKRSLRSVAGSRALYKIMLNSEHGAPISYDELTVQKAVEAGAMRPGERLPRYARGVFRPPGGRISAGTAEPVRFLRWFDGNGGDAAINRVAADAARGVRPGLLVTTDPLADGLTYGYYRGMDILQDWVRVHRAPRDPLSVAYRAERLKAHRRREGGEIWIGPQLGSNVAGGGGYGAPADQFEEALWLAVAFGARGVTCWGYNTIRRDSALDMDTWGRIGKFRKKLLGEYAFLPEAQDAPRDCAVLLSKANQVLSRRSYYEVEENYENFYRVLLTAHVPADVVYDDDVLAGGLGRYKALFLPGIEKMPDDIKAAVGEFAAGGGRVIRWPFMRPLYRDYEITKGNVHETFDGENQRGKDLLPHQYRKWRRLQAAKLFETVADLMEVRCDNPDVVMNVVEAGGKRYVVLVNDRRTYGAWTAERGYRWAEDKGEEVTATITTSAGNSKALTVTIPAAGIAVRQDGRFP